MGMLHFSSTITYFSVKLSLELMKKVAVCRQSAHGILHILGDGNRRLEARVEHQGSLKFLCGYLRISDCDRS